MVSDSAVFKSALIRAGRSFLQVFIGLYLAGLIGDGTENNTLQNLLDLANIEKAFVAGIIAVLSALHRLLDTTPIPSLADKPPSAVEGVEPEPPEQRF